MRDGGEVRRIPQWNLIGLDLATVSSLLKAGLLARQEVPGGPSSPPPQHWDGKSTYHYLQTRLLLLCGYFLKSYQLPTSFLTSSWDSAGKDLIAFPAHLAGHYVNVFPGFLMAERSLSTADFSPSPIHGLGECYTAGHSSSHQAQSIRSRSSYFGGSWVNAKASLLIEILIRQCSRQAPLSPPNHMKGTCPSFACLMEAINLQRNQLHENTDTASRTEVWTTLQKL